MENASGTIQSLIQSDRNELSGFAPMVEVAARLDASRHTPLIGFSSPWSGDGRLLLQTPEFAWGMLPGERQYAGPLFYGGSLAAAEHNAWAIRFPSLEKPVWKPRTDGGLDLDNPLQGGHVVRFRVIPRDRMLEVRFGVTNGSDTPFTELHAQLCLIFRHLPPFDNQDPQTALMLCDGKLVSWAGLGQDVSWIDAARDADSGRIAGSCFFKAPVKGLEPPDYPPAQWQTGNLMWLAQPVDLPAIAKSDGRSKRYVIHYSPFGRMAFFNALSPCCHADPYMCGAAPGETRWTTSYILFFEGDISGLMDSLRRLHAKLRREAGFLTV